ncbi:MAG: hypothetical protein Aurels2KO_41100 [Aureliella sp.]
MIPAILSCVFVAYLYKTLNAEPETVGSTGGPVEERVRQLRKRIEDLTRRLESKGEGK